MDETNYAEFDGIIFKIPNADEVRTKSKSILHFFNQFFPCHKAKFGFLMRRQPESPNFHQLDYLA